MARTLSFSSSSFSNGWGGWWNWWRGSSATATALNGHKGNLFADTLNLSATAVSNRGTATAIGLNNSNIGFTGSNVNISAFAQGRTPYAMGMNNSLLYVGGSGDKTININAHSRLTGTYDPSWGLRNSSLYTGSGSDLIKITTSAASTGWRGGNVKTFGMENSKLSTGFGHDSVCLDNSATTSRISASATSAKNSSIDLGAGNDVITASTRATGNGFLWSADAKGLDRSVLSTGDGDDYVGFGTVAANYRDNSFSRDYGYDRSGSYSRSTYYYDYSTSWNQTYENSYEYSGGWGRGANATAVDARSTVTTGAGNDQVFLNAITKGGDYGTAATGIRFSELDTGEGNDKVGILAKSNNNAFGAWNADITLGVDLAYGHDCGPKGNTSGNNGRSNGNGANTGGPANQVPGVGQGAGGPGDGNGPGNGAGQGLGNGSSVSYVQDDDSLTIRAEAIDKQYSTSTRSYENNVHFEYDNRRWGYGYEYDYSTGYKQTSTTTYDGNSVEAYGIGRSDVSTGSGDDKVSIEAVAERTARTTWGQGYRATAKGVFESELDLGSGDDSLSVDAKASSEYNRSSTYEYTNKYEYVGDDGSTRGHDYGYERTSGYADSITGQAYAVDGSLIDMGSGDDKVTLTSNNVIARNSTIDMGAGNDLLTMGGSTLSAFQNSMFNGGDGYDRIAFTDISADDLGSLASQVKVDYLNKSVTLGSSTFTGFEEVAFGETVFNVSSDFTTLEKEPALV